MSDAAETRDVADVEKTFDVAIGDHVFSMVGDGYLGDMDGVFEPDTVELFRALVKPGGVALDIGANVGCTALLLSQLAGETVCFEPSPTTFRRLEKNVSVVPNVRPVNLGLGRESADLNIVFSRRNSSGGFISSEPLAGHVLERVKIVSGDEYLPTELGGKPVDFVKIDVEGFELDVLAGIAQTIARDRPVVTLELNHWCLNAWRRMSVPDYFDGLLDMFPLLYAVHHGQAVPLNDPEDRLRVMARHILHFEYPALVAAFDEGQLTTFIDQYVTHAKPSPPRIDLNAHIQRQQELIDRQQEVIDQQDDRAARQRERIARLKRRAERRERQAERALAELEALRDSTSWRVTRPLRAFRNFLS